VSPARQLNCVMGVTLYCDGRVRPPLILKQSRNRNRNLKTSNALLKSAPGHQLIHERCDHVHHVEKKSRQHRHVLAWVVLVWGRFCWIL